MAPPRTPRILPPGMGNARRSAILVLVGVVASSMPLPYTAAAAVPLIWAGVESVRAIRAMSGGRAPTRGIVWSVIGLVMVSALTVMVLLPYAVYGQAKSAQDCAEGANTAAAMAECRSSLHGGLMSILSGFGGAGS